MVIKAAAGRQVDALLADLSSSSEAAREAAVARLTIIGARAVERLAALAGSAAPAESRVSALRALDAIGDPRALATAVRAAHAAEPAVATAALTLLRGFLRGPHGPAALDAVAAEALDSARDGTVRAAAIAALEELEPSTRAPIWKALAADPDPRIRALVSTPAERRSTPATTHDLETMAQGRLPRDPERLRRALAHAPPRTPLSALEQLVGRIRDREALEPPATRAAWATARAAAHRALASRRSRLALYDLREWLERAEEPLPVDALAALEKIGDVSCLEPIAAAYARTAAEGRGAHDWWRQHLADVFRTIARRERVTRRHAVAKRIAAKWAVAEELWPGRTRP